MRYQRTKHYYRAPILIAAIIFSLLAMWVLHSYSQRYEIISVQELRQIDMEISLTIENEKIMAWEAGYAAAEQDRFNAVAEIAEAIHEGKTL